MTIEELQIAKELYDKVVAKCTRTNQSCDSINSIVDNIDDSRLKIQYEAAMNDPRRI